MAIAEREFIQSKNYAEKKKIVMYEPDFDTNRYQWLYQMRFKDSDLYEQKKQAFDQATTFNLQTTIGERLNAGLSERRDKIEDGVIRDVYTNEPLLDIFERGRKYRAENGSSISDQLRERAEVIGFSHIQKILCGENTPVGTMMLSISPPGGSESIYKHNFYDVFTLKQAKEGRRYIDARRYSSALGSEEYVYKVLQLKPDYFQDPQVPKDLTYDAYFLSHPIQIDPRAEKYKNADDLHADFHKKHDYVTKEEYGKILQICVPFILYYNRILNDYPYDIKERNTRYNAVLNKADQTLEWLRSKKSAGYILYDHSSPLPIEREASLLGRQPVRQVAGPCGPSSGFSSNSAGGKGSGSVFSDAFSIADFGISQEWFVCPKCKFKADGPIGNKCPGCGLTKEDYAEESGEPVCD